MDKHNFLYKIKNFEEIFAENLTLTDENSVDNTFAEGSKRFMAKLKEKIDLSLLKNLDRENSTIEVSDEGETRVWLEYKGKSGGHLNGIEIYIIDEITIEWFGETHEHFGLYDIAKKSKDGDFTAYSEIDEAVDMLVQSLTNVTKILRVSWKGQLLSVGIWDSERGAFSMVYGFRPIIFMLRLLMPWTKKEKSVFRVDWGCEP